MSKFDSRSVLSKATSSVEESPIIRMAQQARELKAAGKPVISLTIGEPDFDTPIHIRNAASTAMNDGFTHYSPIAGFPELRAALAEKFKTENGLDYSADQITVSNGAKQMICNACFALLDEGDEVIMLAPYWAAYESVVRMAGGVPVVLHAGVEENFKVPAARIADALNERSKLLIINSPSNPSGAMYSKDELEALAAVVRDHPRLMVLSDEIYEYIAFDAPHLSLAGEPDMAERVVVINGFSKGFAMTGWRLGYAGGPEPVIKAMSKVQGTFTAGANAFVQQAAIAALRGGREEVEDMRQSYQRRRDLVVQALSDIEGIKCPVPPGTFYIFPDVSSYFGKKAGNRVIANIEELCEWLIQEHLLATVPGTAFGNDKCLRLSFSLSDDDLIDAMARLKKAFALLN